MGIILDSPPNNKISKFMEVEMSSDKASLILNELKKCIKGKDDVLENVLTAVLAGGHLLIEDVPGVGKTTLVKALAKTLDLSYKRVQFTPDLMPSDIIGVNIFNRETNSFEFKKGPIFNQVFLADEINRTSPKTQSSLLQAMEEGEVTTEDSHFVLDKPFIVLATQNPLEYQGTYPLPEAQLDRFIMKLSMGYPEKNSEISILKNYKSIKELDMVQTVASAKELLELQTQIENIRTHEDILNYIVNISNATRVYEDIRLGASPRASIDLLKASRAKAFISGRDYCIPDDVKAMAIPVLSHRIRISSEARIERKNTEDIIRGVLNRVSVPVIQYE